MDAWVTMRFNHGRPMTRPMRPRSKPGSNSQGRVGPTSFYVPRVNHMSGIGWHFISAALRYKPCVFLIAWRDGYPKKILWVLRVYIGAFMIFASSSSERQIRQLRSGIFLCICPTFKRYERCIEFWVSFIDMIRYVYRFSMVFYGFRLFTDLR